MKSNCIICKHRKTCFNYQIGGLLIDTWCNRFEEEPEIQEEDIEE